MQWYKDVDADGSVKLVRAVIYSMYGSSTSSSQ